MKKLTVQQNELISSGMVSIVVSTFRRDLMLERALYSLCRQTYDRIEIIVVDDNGEAGWNRKVRDIVDKIKTQCRFPMKLIVFEKNSGPAEARNKGIDAAKGEYITFLDDDDEYLKDKVKSQVKAMQRQNADYGLTDLYLYKSEDKPVDRRVRSYLVRTDTESLMRYHLLYHMTGTDTLMFKRDYLLKIGCFPKVNVGEEFYLMMNAIEGGGKLCYTPECKVKAYIHSGESAGLSSGYGKIEGENNLYRAKKPYLRYLSKTDKRYIKVRHMAVLAYAYLRMKKYPMFLSYAARAFLISPSMTIKIKKEH